MSSQPGGAATPATEQREPRLTPAALRRTGEHPSRYSPPGMRPEPDAGGRRPLGVSGYAALVVAAVGLLNLAGWALGIEVLRSLRPGWIVTIPNTAVTFILAAAALWLSRREDAPRWVRALAMLAGAAVLGVGVAFLTERLTRVDLGIDLLLFPEAVRRYPFPPPGRPVTNSALGFALAGAALLALHGHRRSAVRTSQLLAALGGSIAALALFGHVYDVQPLYSLDRASGMAPLTALLFATLNAGIFFARPRRAVAALITGDDIGGVLVRRVMPAVVLAPVVLGWLQLQLRQAGLVSREGGVAVFAMATILVMMGVVIGTTRVIREIDREREALMLSEAVARAEAEQASRAKSEFLAVMSHELRTPLNAIAGYTDLLRLGIRGPVSSDQEHDLRRIDAAQRHLTAVINDILNFVRIETGRIEYTIRSVRVAEAVEALDALVAPQMQAKGIEYRCVVGDGELVARADREKLDQILVNLLGNAIKFTPAGGRITIDCVGDEGEVLIRVRDTGPGISREKLSLIFEPFVQVDRGLARQNDGVGLGLSISRELARGMGGDLRVESEIGAGSVFTVVLARDEQG